MCRIRRVVYFLILFIGATSVYANTASFLLLHTNDMHDYIKPGPNNLGGVPYAAGYIAEQRRQRNDILLLDGGDVMEKGDMVSYVTHSRVMYEAMRKMGYAAGAIGNHDMDHGVAYMKECEQTGGYPLLCINHFNEDGSLAFTPSVVVEVNGIKVGIIGMSNMRKGIKTDGALLAAEAKRLETDVNLTAVVAHIGSRECEALSLMAPEVDVFVSAHTHEILKSPKVVAETGAIIVQAGQYAQYVGRVEITVDLNTKKIAKHDGTLIEMAHDKIKPDEEMVAWIMSEEQKYCPEAKEIVGSASRIIKAPEVALFAAAAMQSHGKADAAFCHTTQVIRNGIYPGDVSANDLFRTGGQRGCKLVSCALTGNQIEAYMVALIEEKNGKTEWAGFKADVKYDASSQSRSIVSSLKKEKSYTVIMTEREWQQRFIRVARKHEAFKSFDVKSAGEVPFTFTDALAAYARRVTENKETLDRHIEQLVKANTM